MDFAPPKSEAFRWSCKVNDYIAHVYSKYTDLDGNDRIRGPGSVSKTLLIMKCFDYLLYILIRKYFLYRRFF